MNLKYEKIIFDWYVFDTTTIAVKVFALKCNCWNLICFFPLMLKASEFYS